LDDLDERLKRCQLDVKDVLDEHVPDGVLTQSMVFGYRHGCKRRENSERGSLFGVGDGD
jgi:hypothetical protein